MSIIGTKLKPIRRTKLDGGLYRGGGGEAHNRVYFLVYR